MVHIATAPRPTGGVAKRPRVDPEALAATVSAGDRAAIGRAITLVESRRDDHRALAADLLGRLQPQAGQAQRIGITGVPGVGKSTFIESFGTFLTNRGHKVAVLAVDPSSSRTGGSILGDKTRMTELSVNKNAFIRPSPSAGTLGGVTRMTRESMVVLEAAGYDVVLVETVGAGQSEIAVAEMVDFFLVLMLAGAGDELQGIKKGVLEIADMIAVNKADGDNAIRARKAAAEYRRALHIMTPISPNWRPPVIQVSGLAGLGLDELWGHVEDHTRILTETGERAEKRRKQQLRWMWQLVRDRLMDRFEGDDEVARMIGRAEREVAAGRTTPSLAADRLLAAFGLR